MPKDSLGNTQQISIKAQNPYCPPSQVFAIRSRELFFQTQLVLMFFYNFMARLGDVCSNLPQLILATWRIATHVTEENEGAGGGGVGKPV